MPGQLFLNLPAALARRRIAREESIVRAARSLHLSQPTLSTQIRNMEEELGKQLLIRGTKGSRKVTLTEEGMILRKRAEEILC